MKLLPPSPVDETNDEADAPARTAPLADEAAAAAAIQTRTATLVDGAIAE